ncbi:hypothetical protein VP01_43g2 [Puccinia sorghi]|uniref:Uncharacterized protein n=1 Tax=Puccinia sorghi TaxID=27349 RepID=A0A0L6UQH7_9BASI|nr:hypothetical protein VP01_43g2 [Puccinia sorghi]
MKTWLFPSTSLFNSYFSKGCAFFSKKYIFQLRGHHDRLFLFILYHLKGWPEIKIIFSKWFPMAIKSLSTAGLICAYQIQRRSFEFNFCLLPFLPNISESSHWSSMIWKISGRPPCLVIDTVCIGPRAMEDQQLSFMIKIPLLRFHDRHDLWVMEELEEDFFSSPFPLAIQIVSAMCGHRGRQVEDWPPLINDLFDLIKLLSSLTCNLGTDWGKGFLDLVLQMRRRIQLDFIHIFNTLVVNGGEEVEKSFEMIFISVGMVSDFASRNNLIEKSLLNVQIFLSKKIFPMNFIISDCDFSELLFISYSLSFGNKIKNQNQKHIILIFEWCGQAFSDTEKIQAEIELGYIKATSMEVPHFFFLVYCSSSVVDGSSRVVGIIVSNLQELIGLYTQETVTCQTLGSALNQMLLQKHTLTDQISSTFTHVDMRHSTTESLTFLKSNANFYAKELPKFTQPFSLVTPFPASTTTTPSINSSHSWLSLKHTPSTEKNLDQLPENFLHSHCAVCIVTVHQSLVETLLEHGWSNNRSFLGLSACQLGRDTEKIKAEIELGYIKATSMELIFILFFMFFFSTLSIFSIFFILWHRFFNLNHQQIMHPNPVSVHFLMKYANLGAQHIVSARILHVLSLIVNALILPKLYRQNSLYLTLLKITNRLTTLATSNEKEKRKDENYFLFLILVWGIGWFCVFSWGMQYESGVVPSKPPPKKKKQKTNGNHIYFHSWKFFFLYIFKMIILSAKPDTQQTKYHFPMLQFLLTILFSSHHLIQSNTHLLHLPPCHGVCPPSISDTLLVGSNINLFLLQG